MGLAPGQQKLVTVSFKANVNFSASITAVVKQSNNFNDSGGSANLFTLQGSFPTLRVVNCVTVSGRVYQDRNLDNTYTTGTGAFLNSDISKGVDGEALREGRRSDVVSVDAYRTTSSSLSSNGSYSFTQVPTGSDYKICVVAAGSDASSKWALQSPAGNADCGQISAGGPTSSAANRLPNLSADAIGPAPGVKCQPDSTAACTDFQVVPVVGPVGANSADSTVESTAERATPSTPRSNSTKADQFYVQDTWVDSHGRTNFRFSPISRVRGTTLPRCTARRSTFSRRSTADVALSNLAGQAGVAPVRRRRRRSSTAN